MQSGYFKMHKMNAFLLLYFENPSNVDADANFKSKWNEPVSIWKSLWSLDRAFEFYFRIR